MCGRSLLTSNAMTLAEIEELKTARANYVRQILDLSDPTARKLTYSVGGRSVSWTEYQKFLQESVQSLDSLLGSLGADQPLGGYIVTAIE